MPSKKAILFAAVLVGALWSFAYAFTQDQDFGIDLMSALFGLSGGNTAGGQ